MVPAEWVASRSEPTPCAKRPKSELVKPAADLERLQTERGVIEGSEGIGDVIGFFELSSRIALLAGLAVLAMPLWATTREGFQ